MLEQAWIIPVIPAVSFFLILLFGKRLPRKGSELGIAAVGAAFVLAIVTQVQWFQHVNDAEHESEPTQEHAAQVVTTSGVSDGEISAPATPGQEADEHASIEPVTREWTWFEFGEGEVHVGTLIDGPAVMMLIVVTLVSLLVHVYSTDYVAGDRRYTHFFAFLSLFTASMLGLVMSSSTLQLMVCWELVGVCSFVLIGHWWEEKANSDAALKAFITNRVGDVGLIVGVIILFFAAGQTFDILDINTEALSGDISHLALLVASCCSGRRRHVQVGPVHPAHLAPRRHGRPHAGVRPHPRRDHGRGRASTWSPGSTRSSGRACRSVPPASTCSRWSAA